jgi:predicted site-specific integrase-resolvase
MSQSDDTVLTTERVAEIFRVNQRTIERWVKDDKFARHGVNVTSTEGGHARFNRDEVYALYWKMIDQGYLEED